MTCYDKILTKFKEYFHQKTKKVNMIIFSSITIAAKVQLSLQIHHDSKGEESVKRLY